MAHTPGPWKVMPEDGIISGNYRGIVAGKGFRDKKTNTGFNVTALMSEADARLIAEAPMMYEALKAIVSLADDDPFATIGMYVEHGKGSNIRALLARIEGGE